MTAAIGALSNANNELAKTCTRSTCSSIFPSFSLTFDFFKWVEQYHFTGEQGCGVGTQI